MGKSSNMQEES